MTPNIAQSYRQASVMTADPMKLVLMCYEGAISNIKLSKNAYLANDYETKGKALQKAIDFIDELNSSLDMEKGRDIAKNLRALYLYFIRLLTEADVKREIRIFEEVVRMLTELESAWKTIAEDRKRIQEAASQKATGISTGYGIPVQAVSGARAWSI